MHLHEHTVTQTSHASRSSWTAAPGQETKLLQPAYKVVQSNAVATAKVRGGWLPLRVRAKWGGLTRPIMRGRDEGLLHLSIASL